VTPPEVGGAGPARGIPAAAYGVSSAWLQGRCPTTPCWLAVRRACEGSDVDRAYGRTRGETDRSVGAASEASGVRETAAAFWRLTWPGAL